MDVMKNDILMIEGVFDTGMGNEWLIRI